MSYFPIFYILNTFLSKKKKKKNAFYAVSEKGQKSKGGKLSRYQTRSDVKAYKISAERRTKKMLSQF